MLRENKRFPKFIFLPFGILFIVGSLAFYFLMSTRKSSVNLRDTFQQSIDILDSKETCESVDLVSYLTYSTAGNHEANNKFGLYVYAENKDFLELAQNLVNSNGGEWGYVLIPYNVKDKDYGKWKDVLERLYNKQLIPIIQLWDVNLDDYEKQTKEAAEFLNSFPWPVKDRYVSVYNEPNDSKFWYDNADPVEYAKILDFTIKTFKEESPDFFMLNGAFNVSASSGGGYYDAFDFMFKMHQAVPGIFSKLDGWASHSYPQPNFSGSPHTEGRHGIRAYEVELGFLQEQLGVKKELPVFITETGWAHAEGEYYNPSYLPAEKTAEYVKIAFEEYWLPDDRVQAVTPFTIWYPPPYDHFSWVNRDGVPYAQYEVIKGMDKVAGNPEYLVEKEVDIRSCLK